MKKHNARKRCFWTVSYTHLDVYKRQVEKIWLFFVGTVVLRSMMRVHTPPMVSMPRERGVTSSSSRPLPSPPSTPPWMAAPMATHSSGLMPVSYTHLDVYKRQGLYFAGAVRFDGVLIPLTALMSSFGPVVALSLIHI